MKQFVTGIQNMNELPQDLIDRIEETFVDENIQAEVKMSLQELGQTNVGKDQLRRAIVFLADGDYERFMELRSSFLGDPRDLLVAANAKLANREYWFATPFSDMGPVAKKK